jgi:malonyl CoA-acyl carrier protein transacylase
MLVFAFPGQGAQKRGMGQNLFDEVKEFTSVEREVDALLGYSIRRLCLEDPENRLNETQYTQPSLYVVNALHYYKRIADGERPNYAVGHSLGEYNALLAAGAFDFVTGLRLVQKRGALMGQARNGGMAAVIGLSPQRIAELFQAHGLNSLDIANFNSPTQIVVSGPVEDIKRAGPVMEKEGVRLYMPLRVSAAFHSRYMAAAAAEFENFLAPFEFNTLKIPVISNVTARPYPAENVTAAIKSLLVRQISQPVQWTDSVRHLLSLGATDFVEVGPGNVLTSLIQQIKQQSAG